eukprot:gnl/TRDRNA2_/TRDRNA2_118145_c0_seq1.p1 gnl/TRDRNA2_/TRDRNA2_118145_c0~~gnl/TRDRNA2_/TRDRNA2_118145_c0_seq1.p1  ORF type:complete len:563 (+),score=56.63 gnl/TRDRNA2_/TRDRNA2_118145_c0_seq1:80-1768(+)
MQDFEETAKEALCEKSDCPDTGSCNVEGEESLYSRRRIGYVAQYFVAGMTMGLPSTMYGVFNGYLNVPAYVYAASSTMVFLPWSFKFFFGALNDCVPFRGFRRKPYMVLGWIACAAALAQLSLQGLPEPYWCRDADGNYITKCSADDPASMSSPACKHNVGQASPTPAVPCNPAAAELGGGLAALLCLVCFGSMVAEVAADGLTVTYAQREPLERRGYTQATVYMIRTVGSGSVTLLIAFGMNGKEYNGSFSWGLSFPTVCSILVLPCIVMVPVSWLCVDEPRVEKTPSLREYTQGVWALIQSGAFFAVIVFSVVYSSIGGIGTTAGVMIQRYWAKVQNLQNQIVSLLTLALFTAGLSYTRSHLLNYSWRKLTLVTNMFLILVDPVFSFFTVFDVLRSQYFYLGESFLVGIPVAVQFMVMSFFVVEAADADNGGLVYGLLTTALNLGRTAATPLSNEIFGMFRPRLSNAANYIADTPSFRKTVAWSIVLGYMFTVLSFVFLPLLPDQKLDAQRRKSTWPHRRCYGIVTLFLVTTTWLYTVSVTVLTMFPETQCLKLVGGSGC